jgi:DNA-binding transcriptional ArsR family regulator
MTGDVDLARVGSLLADRARAAMLLALLAGRPQSASALANAAGVSAPSASAHLKKLVDGDLLVVEPVGRQRMYRLANAVADALEGLLLLAPPSSVRSLRAAVEGRNLRYARLCYDHLAGMAGVAVTEALRDRGFLAERADGYAVTGAGADGFGEYGIDVPGLADLRRPLTRRCMDWSERRYHLAGALGAGLMARLGAMDWIRVREASRVVTVTADGRRGLREWLGIDISAEA